ncbi:caspase-8-like [Archocentrus centrarchus]|uniref:caspase-8-like n=1 Tax=Archocentrus centrarchus TaxID=63155 RepID=UPI0011EA4418|nr:caspase-8-like [Archocentrus centrarchus]
MKAKDALRNNKTAIHGILSGDKTDYRLILNKVHEKKLITQREYNNLKYIEHATVETYVVELVDKIMNKGEEQCKEFLDLLQTDDEIKQTFPELNHLQLNHTRSLSEPVQASSSLHGDGKQPKGEVYQISSRPVGLCVIINNENFTDGSQRRGTDKDAQSLAQVFSWLGFRVLMCKDQTMEQMDLTLTRIASLADVAQLQEFNFKEWSGSSFTDPQQGLKHGDAFICCILSHGKKGVVLGVDWKPLPIKEITRKFSGSDHSALTGKPKAFLIQACQGGLIQRGVLLKDLEADDHASPLTIPVEADVLVAMATVEDHAAFRDLTNGSWFIQSLCQELNNHCPRGEDIVSILNYVNNDVAQKEGSSLPGAAKQMPEVKFTLRKKLVLLPQCS